MKYKVTTITTQHFKSTYMIEASDEKDACTLLANNLSGAELINQEAYGDIEFPGSMDDFIVETF